MSTRDPLPVRPDGNVLLLLAAGFSYRPTIGRPWSRDGNVYTESQAIDVVNGDSRPNHELTAVSRALEPSDETEFMMGL